MEILLELVLQLFLELGLQLVFELLIEAVFRVFQKVPWEHRTLTLVGAVIMYLVLGLTTGFLSLLIFPESFIRSARFHGISLIVTPLLAGLAMSGIGWLRRRQGKPVLRLDTFGYGFVFAFGMALVRFLFTA